LVLSTSVSSTPSLVGLISSPRLSAMSTASTRQLFWCPTHATPKDVGSNAETNSYDFATRSELRAGMEGICHDSFERPYEPQRVPKECQGWGCRAILKSGLG